MEVGGRVEPELELLFPVAPSLGEYVGVERVGGPAGIT